MINIERSDAMAGAIGSREKVTLKNFSPEQGGQRVGLVTVGPSERDHGRPDPRPYTDIDIIVANVSEEGAQYGYTEVHGTDAEKFVMGEDISGFVAVSALHLQVWEDLTVEQAIKGNHQYLYAAEGGQDAKDIIDRRTKKEATIWAEGSNEVLSTIKEQLAGEDVERFYPFVYYMLNAAIGDRETRSKMIGRSGAMYMGEVTPLADPEMNDTTQQLLDRSSEIADSLEKIISIDEKMQQDLKRFSDVPADQLPERFIKSRKQVHEAEAQAIVAGKALLIPQMSFLRTGYGRSWPYMDASGSLDDEGSFGRELHALEDKNEEPAVYQLGTEINETQRRHMHAQSSVNMLSVLSQAEQE